jgi:CTP synthase (UTP-ammonia lyase)
MSVRVAIVGERNDAFAPHRAVELCLAGASAALSLNLDARWVATDAIERVGTDPLREMHAIWISPGSPYRSLEGALLAIRFARENGVPLLGTCGGFQHLVLEYARNVMGIADAQHAEIDPTASRLILTALTRSPAGKKMPVTLLEGSRVASWYGRTRTVEQYYCNYGVNPAYEADLQAAGLRVVGRDDDGEPRIVDLETHPFYVGALYVPQPTADVARPHALVAALLQAAHAGAASGRGPQPVFFAR